MLTDDLIEDIFDILISASAFPSPRNRRLRLAIRLSHICSHFRTVIISGGRFWNRLHLTAHTQRETIELVLARTILRTDGALTPLVLFIDCASVGSVNTTGTYLHPKLALIIPYFPLAREITFNHISWVHDRPLGLWTPPSGPWFKIEPTRGPILQRLCLNSSATLQATELVGSSTTHVEITHMEISSGELTHILNASPNLAYLILRGVTISGTFDFNQPDPRLNTKGTGGKLRELVLDDMRGASVSEELVLRWLMSDCVPGAAAKAVSITILATSALETAVSVLHLPHRSDQTGLRIDSSTCTLQFADGHARTYGGSHRLETPAFNFIGFPGAVIRQSLSNIRSLTLCDTPPGNIYRWLARWSNRSSVVGEIPNLAQLRILFINLEANASASDLPGTSSFPTGTLGRGGRTGGIAVPRLQDIIFEINAVTPQPGFGGAGAISQSAARVILGSLDFFDLKRRVPVVSFVPVRLTGMMRFWMGRICKEGVYELPQLVT